MTRPLDSAAFPAWQISQEPVSTQAAGCHSAIPHATFPVKAGYSSGFTHRRHQRPAGGSTARHSLPLVTAAHTGVGMFDAFIINRIRRERQREQERRIPLHIEAPRPQEPPRHERRQGSEEHNRNKRGVEIIDYSI